MGSVTLLREVVHQLSMHAPFSQMAQSDLEFIASHAKLAYFAPGEVLLDAGEAARACWVIRDGAVTAAPPPEVAGSDVSASELVSGDVFPVGSLLERRPPRLRYTASADTFCWTLSAQDFDGLIQRSPVFLDFCRRRLAALAELSRQAVQSAYAGQAAQWRLMGQSLQTMVAREPVTCVRATPLREAFSLMDREKVGSVLVIGEDETAPVGILTLQDVIGRVLLPGKNLSDPISSVMSHPVSALDAHATVADAMMLMAERRIRHVPVMDAGRLIGIVTERDLFALQRRSQRQISGAIDGASSPERLVAVAADIRAWARALVAQGMSARHVTRLISRLNDSLTERLVRLLASEAGLAMSRFCWLAFGSEGREEQTIATDQDNGIVFSDEIGEPEASRLLNLGADINAWLDRCGYPLCQGNIMAGNPECSLSVTGWRERFSRWIAHAGPQDLLNASIFFDLRPLCGNASLASALRDHLQKVVPDQKRFLKLLSDNAQRNSPPVSLSPGLLGAVLPDAPSIDLKLSGTMPLVDGARLMALAAGLPDTGTAERFEALIKAGIVTAGDGAAWVDAFEYLQGLRLRVQLERGEGPHHRLPNRLDLAAISELDRRILKECFRQVRKLQQRLALDYP